jgi:hypothetical protein
MQDDLLQLVCATYNNAMMGEQDSDLAFARAVVMVQRRRPLLTGDAARRVVSQILAEEHQIGEVH